MLILPSDHFLNIHFSSIAFHLHHHYTITPSLSLSFSLPHCCKMGKPPCCDKSNVKRGLWTAEEDAKILAYVSNYGVGNWTLVPKKAGLNRCGKSCRLRWTNYLRPDLRHDSFSPQEEELIIKLHQAIGSRWSLIAKQLPGRTDNDVKNYWNTKLRKKLSKMGIDPITHKPFSQILFDYGSISSLPNTPKPVASFNNRTFNTTLMAAKPQPSPEIPIPNMNNPSATNSFSWGFLGHLQNPTQVQNPHFFNEVTSSSSSSSSSFNGSDILFHYPPPGPHFEDFPKPSSDLSSSEQSHGIQSFLQSSNGVGMEGVFASAAIPISHQSEASSSSFNSFVDALLEQDIEIKGSFPELLDGCFDY